jgi:stearoyl-CoA desaturase (delta-9 desaturase)
VKGASVQASNIPWIGFITHGECWHNNHHAFPEFARIGLEKGQTDSILGIYQLFGKVWLGNKHRNATWF